MQKYIYKKHPRNTYVVNDKIYHSKFKICDDLHCGIERLERYIKEGQKIKNKYKQTTYVFNFPIKETNSHRAKIIDSYKVGDIIGTKQITNIFEVNNEKRFMMKCLRCGKIREYHTSNLDQLFTNRYCLSCRDKGSRKEIEYKGQIFGSMTDLANHLGLDVSTVSRHLKRNGNLNTIGKLKNPKYKAGVIIGNNEIIAVNGKIITAKCLKCGNIYTFNKTRIAVICKKEDCPHCHIRKGLKYSNIEYKGVIYSTLTEFEKKTGYDRCTAINHLKLYGNLDRIGEKHIFRRYKAGDIINNVEFIKHLKTKNKATVKCLKCGHKFTIHKNNLSKHIKNKHQFRCKYCNKSNTNNSFKNKFAKPGYKVKYKGKTYISMHELARKLGISPGKVIGQYHRHNGNLSGLRIK